ncbi:MmgE/PrpD family protein [Chitinophaga filiformis]|uniref:2-methylcitrate dehydratase n=1 Tax=Chitinophaga filiformis TaxID=104663 RepID=A0A1G7NFK8_CHIFI|nr:MmgE/PrpD family protein [Chitinophaga filiformis]SDF72858.1 2-methylcitrate dehydratase [Chitinophaga filiformis]
MTTATNSAAPGTTSSALTTSMARFANLSTFSQLDTDITDQLKRHLLDAIGSMIYASRQDTIQKCLRELKVLQQSGDCSVPLLGTTGVDRAAQWYTQLIRYPDFMDNYLGKDATCHPSDNIGAILAASQLVNASGRDILTAMAIAYQVQCKLVDEIPVMMKGIDHTMLLACSITATLCRLFSLDEEQAAHAIGTAACSFNPAVGSRQSYTYEWKGLASSLVASACMQIVLLAKEGITGPVSYFEGSVGFEHLTGMKPHFRQEKGDFSLIPKCILKSYNAEVHTQSAIEAALMLRQQYNLVPGEIKEIKVTTFETAYDIVGGGHYGDRHLVQTKEQADHSMPYVIAVALIDGEVTPDQFLKERIRRPDVQELLRKVSTHTNFPLKTPRKVVDYLDPYTSVYPDRMPVKVTIKLDNGEELEQKCDDFKGFFTRPLTWDDVIKKFSHLSEGIIDQRLQSEIIRVIHNLENESGATLTTLLAKV